MKQSFIRPPVVVILGHVDHGKTTLLDKLRKTNLAAKEKGAITQKIGAYQLVWHGKSITFIDTPGHAAFEKMRSRGAELADIAILLVAADEGVKPQTVEAIKHIQKTKIPMIVAINKIDLPNANPSKVKDELVNNNVLLEGFGGQVPWVEISAKTGVGLDNLLELIILVSELEEIKCDINSPFEGIILEASLDRKRGPVATIIVKNGVLKVSDEIVAGTATAKVRAILNDKGESLSIAYPSMPVEVLGFKNVPEIGIPTHLVVGSQKTALIEASKPSGIVAPLELIRQREARKEQLLVIIKTDVLGSLEAIVSNLPEKVQVISQGTGVVTDHDLLLAESSGAIIYSFNLPLPSYLVQKSKNLGVIVKSFDVIYKLLEDIEKELNLLVEKKFQLRVAGRAKILAEFNINHQRVAGCIVNDGYLEIGREVRLVRGDNELGRTEIVSLKQKAKSVQRVNKNQECGLLLKDQLDFKVGDIIELLPVSGENK